MWKLFVYILLFLHFGMISSSIISIGVIHNVYLLIFDSNSTTINGTCDQCICAMVLNTTSFSFLNCFQNNKTCQMFSKSLETRPFRLMNNSASSFYFFQLPFANTTSTTVSSVASTSISSSAPTTGTTVIYTEYLWPFDSTFQDLSSTFNGKPVNGAGFNSSSITGYGASLALFSALHQWVEIDSPFLNLSYQSWTFEAWIYPWTISSAFNGIVSQCAEWATDQCLQLFIDSGILHLAFYHDDLTGKTALNTSKWYHVAFVFDNVNRIQSIYLNGVFERSRQVNHYLGNNGSLVIGNNDANSGNNEFNGLIDQLYFINRTKTASEILDDATLTLYFSFEGGSIYDQGPLRINGSRVGVTNVVTGPIGDALQIGPSADSYFTVSGLVLLGISNQSYSMSIWIKPNALNGSSIIHVSASSNSDPNNWCLGMLGLSSSGQLIAVTTVGASNYTYIVGPILSLNSWIHAAITYSVTNGLRLYVNGAFWNSTGPLFYFGSGTADYLFLGSPLSGTSCDGAPIINGQYSGAIDEFRLYSRELSAANVFSLANP